MTDEGYKQKNIRIRLAIYAMSYECYNHSLVADNVFDMLAKEVDTSVSTDRPDLDAWYKEHYTEHSGMWIWGLPVEDRMGIRALTERLITYQNSEVNK